MRSNTQHDLKALIRAYALNLMEQAELLNEIGGSLAAENRSEASAYLAVAYDLDRILADELGMAGIRLSPARRDATVALT